jgi:transposase
MLYISSSYRFYLSVQSTDMRKGVDSLSGMIREVGKDPLCGDIYIFLNRRRTQIKLLLWEGDGFSLYYKRLEKGTYEIPSVRENTISLEIKSDELLLILHGIVLKSVQRRNRYKRVSA